MKGNLLLVDDETALTDGMRELLEDEADEIFVAANGLEGLKILEVQKIDCIVSDIKMPVMDGIKLLKEVRSLGLDTPFIFYTGHGCDDLRKQVAKEGANELLTKPNYSNLEQTIRKFLAEKTIDHV